MNPADLDRILSEYRKADEAIKQAQTIKAALTDQLKSIMKTDQMDQVIASNGTKVSYYQTKREMYLKEKLRELIDANTLAQCTKVIISEQVRVTYPKGENI